MGNSSFALLLLLTTAFSFLLPLPSAATMTSDFKCGNVSTTAKCRSLVGFSPPNDTTLGDLQTLFTVKSFRSILAVNNLPLSTSHTLPWSANRTIRIPIPCSCSNGTGISDHVPMYTVKDGDNLYLIASILFQGLLQNSKIADVNKIKNPNIIDVGQRFWIPLPCSCDRVADEDVVHYAHIVTPGSSVGEIAAMFDTDNATLLRLNGIVGDNELLANYPFDVPLKACGSSVRKDSSDSQMLLVANGSYALTANNCVKCSCHASNNWTLSCEPTQLKPTKWQTCPSMQCQGAENLVLGNTTTDACGPRSCSYAGYSDQTIFTTLSPDCSASPTSGASASTLFYSNLGFSFVSVQILLFCLHLLTY